MSKIISEHSDPFEARGRADLLARQTGIKHVVTGGINDNYAVRKVESSRTDDVVMYVNRHIPMAEIERALKAFGFEFSYDCGQFTVNYAKSQLLKDIESDDKFMKTATNKVAQSFLDKGWER